MTTVGLCLPQLSGAVTRNALRTFCERAETIGFVSLWVRQHLFYLHQSTSGYAARPGLATPEPYRSTLSALEILSAAASWTETVDIGTSVLVAGYHRPVDLAQRLATLDLISSGRLIPGFSVGWSDDEHEQMEVDPRTRGARCDELIEALLACWEPDPVSFSGKFFTIPPADISPKPLHRPRLLSGMRSGPGLRRTAELFDIWNPAFGSLEDSLDTAERLADMRQAHLAPLDLYWRVFTEPPVRVSGLRTRTVDELCGEVLRAREAGIAAVIIDANFASDIDSTEDCAALPDRLAPLVEAAR